jgi:predicted DNA-binding WGR domain protein
MPDKRSPVRRAVILRRVKPELRMARFYSVMIERDLFGAIVLVRNFGKIGKRGREIVQEFASEDEATAALEALARAKRRRGYRDL